MLSNRKTNPLRFFFVIAACSSPELIVLSNVPVKLILRLRPLISGIDVGHIVEVRERVYILYGLRAAALWTAVAWLRCCTRNEDRTAASAVTAGLEGGRFAQKETASLSVSIHSID